MKILIDGQGDLLTLKNGFDPAGLMNSIESTLHAGKRVIRRAVLNGQEKSPEELEALFSAQTPKAGDTLNIETADLAEHLDGLLGELCSSLDGLEERAVSIADRILSAESSRSLGELSEWCGEVNALLDNLSQFMNLFQVDVGSLKAGTRDFQAAVAQLRGFLGDVVGALGKNEKNAVADLLEFEIAGLIAGLKDVFPHLRRRLGEVYPRS